MKKTGILFLASVLYAAALPASAQNYMGEYQWLRFWDTQIKTSDASWNSAYGNVGWLSTTAAGKHWYQLTFPEAMNLSGANVEAYFQDGTVNYYDLQYTTDLNPDENSVWKPLGTVNGGAFQTVGFTAKNATAIRVLYPDDGGSYTYSSSTPSKGPGLTQLIPFGTPASGVGLDPANPNFNILATAIDRGNPQNNYLGIDPTITPGGKAYSETGADLFDCRLGENGPRTGWAPTSDPIMLICEFGNDVSLEVHGITLYGGVMAAYLPLSVDVYVTDDPNHLTAADFAGTAQTPEGVGGLLTWSSTPTDPDFVGRYVVLTHPTWSGDPGYFLFGELAVNARAPVPEPATMTLLALGGLAMLRRRK